LMRDGIFRRLGVIISRFQPFCGSSQFSIQLTEPNCQLWLSALGRPVQPVTKRARPKFWYI